jgi:hypothetical protein
VTKGQVFEVPFEGHGRLFQVAEFEPTEVDVPEQKLAEDIAGLSIAEGVDWHHVIQSAAEVDWETRVDVVEERDTKVNSRPLGPLPSIA